MNWVSRFNKLSLKEGNRIQLKRKMLNIMVS